MALYQDLKGKQVLVTGAASGIGAAQVQAFLQQGAKVTGIDRKPCDLVDPNFEFQQLDLTHTAELLEFLKSRHFEIVCQTAGILDEFQTVSQTDLTDFQQVLQVNLTTMFVLTKALLAKTEPVNFIYMSSYAGVSASGGGVSYTVAKHAIVGLMRDVAFNYGTQGVRANAIAPCLVNTPMAAADFATGLDQKLAQETVLKRYAEPAEIANLTLFLASKDSEYIVGQVIEIDGGYRLGKEIE